MKAVVCVTLLYVLCFLYIGVSESHITTSSPISTWARVEADETVGGQRTIVCDGAASGYSGPHEAPLHPEPHIFLGVNHHVITLDIDRANSIVFVYHMRNKTIYGGDSRTSRIIPPTERSVLGQALWGFAWAWGEIHTEGESDHVTAPASSHSLVVHPNDGGAAQASNILIPLQPIQQGSDLSRRIEAELSEVIDNARQTDPQITDAVNYNGRIYTFRSDEDMEFDGTGVLSNVTAVAPIPAAPGKRNPRSITTTTTWAAIKKR